MKLGHLIKNLQKFDPNLDVEIWIDESEGFANIGYNVYVDLDTCKEKTLEVHIGEHNMPIQPKKSIDNAKKNIKKELNFDINDFYDGV